MHASVLEKWHEFSTPLEGRVHSMYLDIKNLITTGVGNLIDGSWNKDKYGNQIGDPAAEAMTLPWKHEATGELASKEEIRAAWEGLKARPDLSRLHWKYAAKLNDLRLTDEDIDALVEKKLLANEKYLKRAYPNWDDFPADAQLGCLSMAWAVGAGFPGIFKNFSVFAVKQHWGSAKLSCKIKTAGNPGVVPRNKNNEICFGNAEVVIQYDLNRSILHWPETVTIPEVKLPEPEPSITDEDRALVQARQVDVAGILKEDAKRELASEEDDE